MVVVCSGGGVLLGPLLCVLLVTARHRTLPRASCHGAALPPKYHDDALYLRHVLRRSMGTLGKRDVLFGGHKRSGPRLLHALDVAERNGGGVAKVSASKASICGAVRCAVTAHPNYTYFSSLHQVPNFQRAVDEGFLWDRPHVHRLHVIPGRDVFVRHVVADRGITGTRRGLR